MIQVLVERVELAALGILCVKQEAEVIRADIILVISAGAHPGELHFDGVAVAAGQGGVALHQEGVQLPQGGIGVAAQTVPLRLARDDLIKDLRQDEEAPGDVGALAEMGGQVILDVQGHRQDQPGAGAAGQGADDDDPQGLLGLPLLQLVEVLDRLVKLFHLAGPQGCVKGEAGDGPHLAGALCQGLAVQDGIHWEPGVPRMGVDIQVLAHGQLGRCLDDLDKRIRPLNIPQLVDIRVKYRKAKMVPLFVADKIGYPAHDL